MRSQLASEQVSQVRAFIGDDNSYDTQTNNLEDASRVTNLDIFTALNYAAKEYCRAVLATPKQVTATSDLATGVVKVPFDSILVQRITVEKTV
jgi:hypothetical protein